MSYYSSSPVRRAQGYLTAQVEWRICSLEEACFTYAQIVAQQDAHNANPLRPQKLGAKPRSKAGWEQRLVERLGKSGIKSTFCRGYLFALVEVGYIKADLAHIIVDRSGFSVPRTEFWLAGYPDRQSHPLYPLSAKVDATWDSSEDRLLAAIIGQERL
jgi:hypothetical protein